MWKAEADDLTGHQGTTRLVAVKTIKEGASDREKEDLDRELEIMKQLGSHPNVVTLLGCCTEEGEFNNNLPNALLFIHHTRVHLFFLSLSLFN